MARLFALPRSDPGNWGDSMAERSVNGDVPKQEPQSVEQQFSARITELGERSLTEQKPVWTDFLEPPQLEQAQAVLGWKTGVRYQSFGGYHQAERRRLVIYPDYYLAETIQPKLAFLEITPGGLTELTHRDYLGALLNLGLKREKIGDLLIQKNGCQLICHPDLEDFIRLNLVRVGTHDVTVEPIEPEQLSPPTLREKEIRTTVASLRLDAVAALGFGESRTKMAREIKAERVRVNWKPVKSPDQLVNPGDIISIRGRGRVIFQALSGRSKKGRQGIVLTRLI